MRGFSDIRLVGERNMRIKEMRGFQKHHRIPDDGGERAEQFVQGLAEAELTEELQSIHASLRQELGYKRKEFQVMPVVDGDASIGTPHFLYRVTVSLDPDDPTKVCYRREASQISDIGTVFSEPFCSVFPDVFSSVWLVAETSIDVDDVIDRLEENESSPATVDYDMDATYCNIAMPGSEAKIRVTADSVQVTVGRTAGTRRLLESFQAVQDNFAEQLSLFLGDESGD